MTENVFLDNAKTTRPDPEVQEQMKDFAIDNYGLPGGEFGYTLEEDASEALAESREIVADEIGAEPDEVIFTSGGTESNNLALKGVAYSDRYDASKILTSEIEDRSVLDVVKRLDDGPIEGTFLEVDGDGFVDLERLKEEVKEARLVSIHHANHEIGTIQDIEAIGEICDEEDVLLHVDAVQSFCREPIDVDEMGVDLLSMSSHVVHGPKGVGALYVRDGTDLEPLFHGGGQEFGLRPGGQNLPGIVGFGSAVERFSDDDVEKMTKMRDELMEGLLQIEDTQLNGPRDDRVCNNVNVSFDYVEGEAVLLHADMRGLIVSTGSACYSKDLETSHVILAIGGTHERAHSSTRLTIGRFNETEDVDFAVENLSEVVRRLRDISPLGKD